MKVGPLVTLGAVVVLGTGIWLVNVSQEPKPASPATPVAGSPPTTVAAPPPSTPPPAAFPAKADYVGKAQARSGVVTVEITVSGDKAIAYACDGKSVEAWLHGSALNGVVNLVNKDNTSRLDGHLTGDNVVGTLLLRQEQLNFTAAQAQPPAGLYVYSQNGVRSSWIIDRNNAVTGVQRRPDGSTSPAPSLSIDGTASINGKPVAATRVAGDSNV